MTKLCECGCGSETRAVAFSDAARGLVKGEPRRFVYGHNRRHVGPEYTVNNETRCWEWQMGLSGGRYGTRGNVLAHRRYYERSKGPVPEGCEIDHTCRNTKCVNPDHLEAVSHAVNMGRRFSHEIETLGHTIGGRPKRA